MTNIVDFNRKDETPVYTYRLAYQLDDGDVVSETFEGDAIMTNSFVGFSDKDQMLLFAVPLKRVVSIRRVNPIEQ